MDLDWAPDTIVADSLELLARYDIRATVFATHRSPPLDDSGHEIGIHPDFTDKDRTGIIRRLLDIYPDAQGVRSHALATCSRTVQAFADCGLLYTSNVMAWLNPTIGPFKHFVGMVEIPFHWGDFANFHQLRAWSPERLPLERNRLFVFNFHPVHIFLNTESPDRWWAARDRLQDPIALRQLANPIETGVGTRVFLDALCGHIAEGRWETVTIGAAMASMFPDPALTTSAP